LDAAAYPYAYAFGVELAGRPSAVVGENRRDRVGEIVAGSVGFRPQRLNLFKRRKTLFQKLLFERQYFPLKQIIIMDS